MRVDQIDTNQYATLLTEKVKTTELLFDGLHLPKAEVFPSPIEQYRLRAEFRMWHQDDDSYYIMFDPANKEKFRVDHYIPGSALIQSLMTRIREEILPNEVLRRRLYQVDFLTTLSGEALVSLIYHKPLDDTWLVEAKALKQRLTQDYKINLIGRARKQKVLVDQDYVTEKLAIGDKTLSYKQIENTFTQPNGAINTDMLNWSRQISQQLCGDLLELYCGNGNFSLALADCFDHVVATEIARTSVKAANVNIQANGINNVTIGQASAEDFSAAYFENKSVKSLKDIDLANYNFSTILVDPPRAGLDNKTVELVQKFDNIIYISCNPETLKDNLQAISQTHTVKQFALFDQFPYTHHIESGVWLQRKA
ncbi:tRNA (uridine(54)-C5)-methyltransferase TrmA [Saccharobesus litoralis]|uniref:tRNA/tmRNA (uracil-C(5))-methyltransferase n=1 Tax=Saccharobesus litoralis TaxID=2172099 RepID=A0A2S0VSD8_9ALTE|nr:tRNA (uridine(54)-C5)-methyltransferase TrmA [Saccharobesus litoralis]AWB67124.1 tRNA (uridine(54)-C5)-methyltransferase TrmA [Saccharobesus litoralis]